jgi:hypothetical protein
MITGPPSKIYEVRDILRKNAAGGRAAIKYGRWRRLLPSLASALVWAVLG